MSRWRLPEDSSLPTHGGPDAAGAARFDFSTNANAAGPLQRVAAAVAAADRSRYPDPAYAALRAHLGAWHGVAAERVVVGGSASELIWRLSAGAARLGRVQRAIVPRPGYGDYAAAARAAGLECAPHGSAERPRVPTADDLWWLTEPASPDGSTRIADDHLAARLLQLEEAGALTVLDLAYQPLRLDDRALPPEAELAWQLWSPNKACGLVGVRAAYAIAPKGEEGAAQALRARAPSWVCGADGVAMLTAFASEAAQDELAAQRATLARWRLQLAEALRGADWEMQAARSVTPFLIARPAAHAAPLDAPRFGLRLRDCTSLGLPGWWRLSAQPPAALDALAAALTESLR